MIGFFISLGVFISTLFHPFYISVCDIAHDPETKALQVSQRVFLNDLETTLRKKYNVRLDVVYPENKSLRDSLIQDYILDNLEIKVDGKSRNRTYLGHEIEDDAMWCYIEYHNVKKVRELSVKNTVFLEMFDTQANLVHFKYQGKTKSIKLDRLTPSGKFTISE